MCDSLNVSFVACSTEQTLSGLVNWDTDRLSPLESCWQRKMETTQVHKNTDTSVHMYILSIELNVLYVQVTDTAVSVCISGQLNQKIAKGWRTKDERHKRRGVFFSWGAYTELRTGMYFHLREWGGGRAPLPSHHQLPSGRPWSHSQPCRSPQAKAGQNKKCLSALATVGGWIIHARWLTQATLK